MVPVQPLDSVPQQHFDDPQPREIQNTGFDGFCDRDRSPRHPHKIVPLMLVQHDSKGDLRQAIPEGRRLFLQKVRELVYIPIYRKD